MQQDTSTPLRSDSTTSSDSVRPATQLPQLPAEVLSNILAQLPLQQRFSSACLVCSEWATAAKLSLRHLQAALCPYPMDRVVERLVEQYSNQLESLQLSGEIRTEITLPWAQLSRLQSVKLSFVRLPPVVGPTWARAHRPTTTSSSSSSSAAAPPLLPQLKHLELHYCTLDSPDCLLRLTSTQLSSLVVTAVRFVPAWDEGDVCQQLQQLLQQSPQLTLLHVGRRTGAPLGIRLQHVNAMQQLQDVQLHLTVGEFDSSLAGLPGSLTRLSFTDGRDKQALRATALSHPTLPPQLTQLGRLQCLELTVCRILPAVLGSVPQLKHLALTGCELLPCVSQQQTSEGVAAFLSAVQSLKRLQSLSLSRMSLEVGGVPLQQYSALTASALLTKQHLDAPGGEQPLPQAGGVLQHIFPANKQLPYLRTLSITDASSVAEPQAGCVSGDDLSLIFSACPNLTALDIAGTVQPGAEFAPLLQLPTSCSSLAIGGHALNDEAASYVGHLTQLTSLSWDHSNRLSDVGLQQLVGLRGLRQLHVGQWRAAPDSSSSEDEEGEDGDDDDDDDDDGANQGPLRLASDEEQGAVWQQLWAMFGGVDASVEQAVSG